MPKETLEDRVKKLEMKIVEIESAHKNVYELITRTIDQIVGSPAFESWMASQGRQSEVRELETRLKELEEERKVGELKSVIESLKQQIISQTNSKEVTSKDLFQMLLLDKKKTDELKDVIRNKHNNNSMKLDPRIDFAFGVLKHNEEIPKNWKIGDFMNDCVLKYIKSEYDKSYIIEIDEKTKRNLKKALKDEEKKSSKKK